MKKTAIILLVKSIVLAWNINAFALEGQGPGAQQTGTTLSLGYDYSNLMYKEYQGGTVLDKDYGALNGISVSVRHDMDRNFARFSFTYRMTDTATYSGAIVSFSTGSSTPYYHSTPERFLTWEAAYGFKTAHYGTAAFSPYVGIGYWDWLRGKNELPDYQEDYTWWYTVIGLSYVKKSGLWMFGIDGAVEFPFNAKMTTNTAGATNDLNFNIKPKPGYRIEIPVNYTIQQDSRNTFVFFTPFYQKWDIGASDPVLATFSGTGTSVFLYEPDSTTDIYGFRIGVGVKF